MSTSSPILFLGIFAGGGAAKSATDANSMRFLGNALANNAPGGANSPYSRLKSGEGRRCEEPLLPSDGDGDGVFEGTLDIAKSTALKLYLPAELELPPPPTPPPLIDLVGVRRSRAGDADDSLVRADDGVVDLGGFIIMADNDSCCILKSADGDMNMLLAANVDFESGSGMPYLPCCC